MDSEGSSNDQARTSINDVENIRDRLLETKLQQFHGSSASKIGHFHSGYEPVETGEEAAQPLNQSVLSTNIIVALISFGFFAAIIVVLFVLLDKHENPPTPILLRPNFVFVLADDLGWSSIGSTDFSSNFSTPFLDSLAQRGIILKQYYTQELCTPARAALLTGRYPIVTGMQYDVLHQNDERGIDLSETLLPQVLKEYGNYTNYLLGKWHLGTFKANYMPTARGFDYSLGFMSGATYHWSKRSNVYPDFHDLIHANTDCYNVYEGTDRANYSTYFYRDKAIEIIGTHNYAASPMFLYFAGPAVHIPYDDYNNTYSDGMPLDYLSEEMSEYFATRFVGKKERQYAMSLYVLDQSVASIYSALERSGQMNNTYFIFASDNGGCTTAGGRNGPLRGEKGTLYEGGTKVDAFVYSPLLGAAAAGASYSGLMHVSDWFPTMLSWAGIAYTPPSGKELTGVDQSYALVHGESHNQRTHLLYNMYYNIENKFYNLYTNGSAAIRDQQYKLLHAYESNYTSENAVFDADDDYDEGFCTNFDGPGHFRYYLFDLLADPNETTNLYDEEGYDDVKAKLYALLEYYMKVSKFEAAVYANDSATTVWAANGMFVQPWDAPSETTPYPNRCSLE